MWSSHLFTGAVIPDCILTCVANFCTTLPLDLPCLCANANTIAVCAIDLCPARFISLVEVDQLSLEETYCGGKPSFEKLLINSIFLQLHGFADNSAPQRLVLNRIYAFNRWGTDSYIKYFNKFYPVKFLLPQPHRPQDLIHRPSNFSVLNPHNPCVFEQSFFDQ
jgi:hypothetical protein